MTKAFGTAMRDSQTTTTTNNQEVSNLLDSVNILNEMGVSLLRRNTDAESCYADALSQQTASSSPAVNAKPPSFISTVSTATVSTEPKTTNATVSTEQPVADQQQEEDKIDMVVEGVVHEQHTDRDEYDEGMHIFPDALCMDAFNQEEDDSMMDVVLFAEMGHSFLQQKEYEQAIVCFESATSALQGCGSSDDLLLAFRFHHNLGYCSYRLKQWDSSLKHYQTACEIAHSLANARFVAASVNCVGLVLFVSGDVTSAHDNLERCLVLYESIDNCQDNADIATVWNNLGRVQYHSGDYEKSLESYAKALTLRRALLPQDSLDVAAVLYNQGQAHQQLHQQDKALACYQEFISLAQAVLGPKHRDVGMACKSVAEVYREQGNLDRAIEWFLKALSIAREALGDSHQELSCLYNKLGNVSCEQEKYDAALEYYQQGLLVEEAVLDPHHAHIVITLTNMAQIHKERQEYKVALEYFTRVYQLQRADDATDALEQACTLSSMGLLAFHQQDYDAALEHYQEALVIRRNTLGTDQHEEIASTLNSLGLVLFRQEAHDQALQCLFMSLEIRKALHGNVHKDIAILWYNIATIYYRLGQEETAVILYHETIRLERQLVGVEGSQYYHHHIVQTLLHIGKIHQQRGELAQALVCFCEVLETEQQHLKNDDLSIAKTLNMIGNIHLQLDCTSEMMKYFSQAARIYDRLGVNLDSTMLGGHSFYGFTRIHPPSAPLA